VWRPAPRILCCACVIPSPMAVSLVALGGGPPGPGHVRVTPPGASPLLVALDGVSSAVVADVVHAVGARVHAGATGPPALVVSDTVHAADAADAVGGLHTSSAAFVEEFVLEARRRRRQPPYEHQRIVRVLTEHPTRVRALLLQQPRLHHDADDVSGVAAFRALLEDDPDLLQAALGGSPHILRLRGRSYDVVQRAVWARAWRCLRRLMAAGAVDAARALFCAVSLRHAFPVGLVHLAAAAARADGRPLEQCFVRGARPQARNGVDYLIAAAESPRGTSVRDIAMRVLHLGGDTPPEERAGAARFLAALDAVARGALDGHPADANLAAAVDADADSDSGSGITAGRSAGAYAMPTAVASSRDVTDMGRSLLDGARAR
jgi:hypothetical protein